MDETRSELQHYEELLKAFLAQREAVEHGHTEIMLDLVKRKRNLLREIAAIGERTRYIKDAGLKDPASPVPRAGAYYEIGRVREKVFKIIGILVDLLRESYSGSRIFPNGVE